MLNCETAERGGLYGGSLTSAKKEKKHKWKTGM